MRGSVKPVRIAVLGAGLIGREHVKFVQAHGSTELVALADVSVDAVQFAQQIGVPCFADFNQLLEDIRPDAAIVALPNPLHVPAALSCVRLGIPALVEKPLADTLPAALQLVAASEAAAVPVLVGHQRRHSPDIRAARDAIQQGRLGALVAISGIWFVRKHERYFDAAWRRQEGGGPFLINLIHDIDCFRFLCGEIESVQAMASNALRGFPVEDTAALIMRFQSGAIGSMVLSDAVPSPWAWDLASGQAPYFPTRLRIAITSAGRRRRWPFPAWNCGRTGTAATGVIRSCISVLLRIAVTATSTSSVIWWTSSARASNRCAMRETAC